jgi:hypothetical protein
MPDTQSVPLTGVRHEARFWNGGCWLRRWDYSRPLASEPDVKVSLHPAQAWNNAPGCVCDTALTGRGFDTVRPLA